MEEWTPFKDREERDRILKDEPLKFAAMVESYGWEPHLEKDKDRIKEYKKSKEWLDFIKDRK
jgi:hypothetical protein